MYIRTCIYMYIHVYTYLVLAWSFLRSQEIISVAEKVLGYVLNLFMCVCVWR